jgi:cell division protein ZapA (FtsZ GTPase activity inhibitor)
MTEPDPIAALAAQVEELRGQLARHQAIVTSWNARLEREGIGGTLMLRHEIKQLTQKLDAEIARFGAEAQREARAETETEIREELKKLQQKLDQAIAKHQAEDLPAPYWLGLSRDEHAAQLAELRGWVDRFARIQWPGYMARIAPCWANHPEAVWELSNLMTEWSRIYADPEKRPLQDALWFYERWLPGVLSRLCQAVKCDVAGCRLTRTSPWERSPPRYS